MSFTDVIYSSRLASCLDVKSDKDQISPGDLFLILQCTMYFILK